MDWIEGKPSEEGLYWLHDIVNGVLFGMVVLVDEEDGQKGLYYYIMGCDMGFPINQLTHFVRVKPPAPPVGSIRINPEA